MPFHSPKDPKLPPVQAAKPTPRRMSIEAEEAKKRQRVSAQRRTGWASTLMTRGGLGQATTQKAKVLGV